MMKNTFCFCIGLSMGPGPQVRRPTAQVPGDSMLLASNGTVLMCTSMYMYMIT